MADIIQILPDSVANQIAAGEVIQRPASVVKELVENSIDAGSTEITVVVKEAGRNLIQIIDNGFGMSETDARMSFERHATSKIRQASDLFCIHTMGFRGEALASIAAVAEVVLKTRKHDQELGLELVVRGSECLSSDQISTPAGTNFLIKNLFYNVPARRKFLKSNASELRYIINEFQRVAMAYPKISFNLIHNDTDIYRLSEANFKQRIVQLFGKSYAPNLVDIGTVNSIVKIEGFIGKPEFSKKRSSDQYFFVNDRYMRHPYFHKAVMQAYERILPSDQIPAYFIRFDVDPQSIDINIHPTKTEIKFEDERSIYQILTSIVKEGLGKFNVTPSLNFDVEPGLDIPHLQSHSKVSAPQVNINPNYNPFENSVYREPNTQFKSNLNWENQMNWEMLYQGFEKELEQQPVQEPIISPEKEINHSFLQLKGKFILIPVKSGLMMIDQKRAHERILYENYFENIQHHTTTTQQCLYPQTMELSPSDFVLLNDIKEEIVSLGFDIEIFGKDTIIINGYPAEMTGSDPASVLSDLLSSYTSSQGDLGYSRVEKVAQSLSKASAIPYGKTLSNEEMRMIVDGLFACANPNHSPMGKSILSIIQVEELEKRLK